MDEIEEFEDALVTVGLAMAIAKRYNESLDDAVRNTAKAVALRLTHLRIRSVYMGLSTDPIAPAVFFMMTQRSA